MEEDAFYDSKIRPKAKIMQMYQTNKYFLKLPSDKVSQWLC